MELPTHYDILGLDRSATTADIRKAYRKMAKLYHPDKNPDHPEAEEKFKAISEAYYILSDEARRKEYDRQLDEPENSEQNEYREKSYRQQQQEFYRRMYVQNSDVPYFKLKMAAFIILVIAIVGVMTLIFKPWKVPGALPPDVMIMQLNDTRIEMQPEHPYYRVLLQLFYSSIRYDDDVLRVPAHRMEMLMDSIGYSGTDDIMAVE